MKNSKWLLPFCLLIFMLSCKKSGTTENPPVVTPDTTKPTISLTDPTAGKAYLLGAALHLQIDLADNVELKSYKVVINKSLKGLITSDWAFTQTWLIPAGKKSLAVNHSEITVPLTVTGNQTTTGNYDLTVTCTDTSGNDATSSLVITLNK